MIFGIDKYDKNGTKRYLLYFSEGHLHFSSYDANSNNIQYHDNIGERINLGTFTDVSALKSYLVSSKPNHTWIARINGSGSAFGTIFNDYQGGYCGFFTMTYFAASASDLVFIV